MTTDLASYTSTVTTRDGVPLTVRAIRPEDEPLMIAFHRELSDHSVYMRYFHMLTLDRRTAHERLARICFADWDHEIVLVADHLDAASGQRQIVAVARLNRLDDTREAELAVLVSDRFQNRGIGSALVAQLMDIARAEKFTRLVALVLTENWEMQALCRRFGFHLERSEESQTVRATIELETETAPATA